MVGGIVKKISIVTSCLNEAQNVREFHEQVKKVFAPLAEKYCYEIIFADNNSYDGTQQVLREVAAEDPNFKVIFNSRDFQTTRSMLNALLQASGDAAVVMASDLQDPPGLISEFITRWEEGNKVVLAVKNKSEEPSSMYLLRTVYYRVLQRMSDVVLIPHFTGFGLYDRQIVEIFRKIDDPNPYFRGLVCDVGFAPSIVYFTQPLRKYGKTKTNLLRLYADAMVGVTNFSRSPLRVATFVGFGMAVISFLVGMFYLVYKLIYWNSFSVGMAPVAVGLFFFASVQLIFLGLLGEYICTLYSKVLKRPLVYERERLNL
jgi:polyisoprenyl-phosphate glycosyltransferase